MDDRGVSDVLAVLLVTVLVVALVAVVAAPLFGDLGGRQTQTHITAELKMVNEDDDANQDDLNITVTHMGGDALMVDETRVAVRSDGVQITEEMVPARVVNGDDDGRFEEGEQWVFSQTDSSAQVGANARVFLLMENGGAAASWEGTILQE